LDEQVQSIVVDGTDHLAGRLSSNVAKMLLRGNRVSIVNCEKIMISGGRRNIIQNYKDFLSIASILHPEHGPYHPRRPDTIMAKMIRGMLPREKPSGIAAHKRLRTYIGVPSELRSSKKIALDKAKITKSSANYTSMADLSKEVG
jgi:large subunit ribosomal protein L13